MTPEERQATEAAVNAFLQNLIVVVVISWWGWWLARKLGADKLFTWRPRDETAAPEGAPPPAPHRPRLPVQARAHAVRARSEVVRPPEETHALTPQLVQMMRLIASHKLQKPGDSKTATAKALNVPRSGTSERYALFSASWSLLYPEPAEPVGPKFPTDVEAGIREEAVAV